MKNLVPLRSRVFLKPYADEISLITSAATPTVARFIIFAQGRTGSTLLQRLLNQHPDVTCLGEPLSQDQRRPLIGATRVLSSGAKRAARSQFRAYGCHVKSYQLIDVYDQDPSAFVRRRVAEGWQVIHLSRNDTARQCISTLVAEQRGTYHRTERSESRQEMGPVRIDPLLAVQLCQRRSRLLREEHKLAEELGLLRLTYESDLIAEDSHQRTASLVFKSIGLEPCAVRTDLKRTMSTALSEHVVNFDEVASALGGAGFRIAD